MIWIEKCKVPGVLFHSFERMRNGLCCSVDWSFVFIIILGVVYHTFSCHIQEEMNDFVIADEAVHVQNK
jgi:hypothetical protein